MKNIRHLLMLGLILISLSACQSQAIEPVSPIPAPQTPAVSPTNDNRLSFSGSSFGLGSVTSKQTGQSPDYEITAQTPALQDSSLPHAGDFGRAVTAVIQAEVDAFKKNLLDLAPQPDSNGSYFDLKYELIFKGDTFYSLQFKISAYAQGAAHPSNRIVSFNYDLARGQVISLDQLFSPGSDYLQIISDYCKSELAKREIAFDSQQQGADALPENYQNWNISDNGLVIVFNEYQVAAYAAGPQIVVIPYSVLKPVINPQNVLAEFNQ